MKKNNYIPIIVTVMVIIVVVIGAFYFGKNFNSVQITTVGVEKFYNGQDGYSISIPGGNKSTCIWTYAGGSGDVPDSQITYANSATEKHTIIIYDYYDFKVNCTDDFGNQYTGIFPK